MTKYEVWVERWICDAFPNGIQIVPFKANEYDKMIDYISGLRLCDDKYYVFDNNKGNPKMLSL